MTDNLCVILKLKTILSHIIKHKIISHLLQSRILTTKKRKNKKFCLLFKTMYINQDALQPLLKIRWIGHQNSFCQYRQYLHTLHKNSTELLVLLHQNHRHLITQISCSIEFDRTTSEKIKQ